MIQAESNAQLVGALAAVAAIATPAAAQPTSPPVSALVATTPSYSFHSDFRANLHDYLYWHAQSDDAPDLSRPGCLDALPSEERGGWETAEAYYREKMGERHHRRDSLMKAIRYHFSGVAELSDPLLHEVLDLLEGATPAYEACFWLEQDRRNRDRIAELLPLLVTFGPTIQARLAELYQDPWPEAVHVDVLPYASWAGANTASGKDIPPHMQISSIDESMQGLSGLEILMHEATHEMFGPGYGTIGAAIASIADAAGEKSPRDLWHALSFYTSGHVMEQVIAESSDLEYTAYWRRTGVIPRAWPQYLEPLDEFWQPYLVGEGSMEEALERLVTATTVSG